MSKIPFSEDDLRTRAESYLKEHGDEPLWHLDLQRGLSALRQGYATVSLAILFGYLFITLPKLIIAVTMFILIVRNDADGRLELAIAIGGLVAHSLWNEVASRLWFRWASTSILPEEAYAFYSLDPTWITGGPLWHRLTSQLPSSED